MKVICHMPITMYIGMLKGYSTGMESQTYVIVLHFKCSSIKHGYLCYCALNSVEYGVGFFFNSDLRRVNKHHCAE